MNIKYGTVMWKHLKRDNWKLSPPKKREYQVRDSLLPALEKTTLKHTTEEEEHEVRDSPMVTLTKTAVTKPTALGNRMTHELRYYRRPEMACESVLTPV